MNDTNRLMLAVAITVLAYGGYPENWHLIGFLAFLFISMSSETVRSTKEGIEYFTQGMDED